MPQPEPIPDLLKAVNDASSRGFALWVSFLSVSTYVAIAIGTTTHLQLLLEAPVKLPLLSVDLPLFAFYLCAPPLFLLLHFYVLMQFYLLAHTVRTFDDALLAATIDESERASVRAQLDAFVLTRLLLGGPDRILPRLFLGATVWFTLLIGPMVLLLSFQLRFLPYHSEWTTWDHRIVLLLDLSLIWMVWPWITLGVEKVRRLGGRSLLLAGVGVGLAIFAVLIATVPDERVERWQPPWPMHTDPSDPWRGRPVWLPTWLLFEGRISAADRGTSSPFDRNLMLPDISLTGSDDEQLAKRDRTVSLRDRDLRYAVLWRSDLRKADLSFARLQHAQLTWARLQGATLDRANAQGASFDGAQMQGASLQSAQLQGASFHYAQLQGVWLVYGKLQGASFDGADLLGASLDGAEMQGASFDGAHMQGASLYAAQMQGASLDGAQLQGASLTFARLTAASLDGAQLQGATLDDTELQGASLDNAQLEGADLKYAAAWRATILVSDTTNADARELIFDAMTDDAIAALGMALRRDIPDGAAQTAALQRLNRLSVIPEGEEAPRREAWRRLTDHAWNYATDDPALAHTLAEIGCEARYAPYVARSLLHRISRDDQPYMPLLARALRDPRCAGAQGLTAADIDHLDAIIATASMATTAPAADPQPAGKAAH